MMHSSFPISNSDPIHRRTHRKRSSTSKLSSEVVHTLPEYSSPPGWNRPVGPLLLAEAESDKPPDYPETADEADADTEGDLEEHLVYVQHHLVRSNPRRSPTHVRRRKRVLAPAPDPFLDTLLERSVHALEMSNTLLRASISTQSSLSTLLSSESESDQFLEVRARNLSTRIRVNGGLHETWMGHLEEISEGVDKLVEGEGRSLTVSRSDEEAVSRSLPITPLPNLRPRRKPSILELNGSSSSHLRYSHPTRDLLVAPAPKALTQYVESSTDPQLITLPSTLGLRAIESCHSVHSQVSSSMHCHDTQSAPMESALPKTHAESTTPAYQLLSNIVVKHYPGSLTPPTSAPLLWSRDRCTSASPTGSVRGMKPSVSSSSARTLHTYPYRSRTGLPAQTRRSRSEDPQDFCTPPPAQPTMPADDELSPSSSDSSEHPTGYRTVQSLRKILDEHSSSISVNAIHHKDPKLYRAPAFLPVTPPPAPIQGTSTATASVSRLYTKGRHSLSTRPPSPPPHSSLKVRSVPPTPAPSPSSISLSEAVGIGVARIMGSAPPSGVSTPKRISFAELPESYSHPGTTKLRARKSRKKKKQGMESDKEESGGWLRALFYGGLSSAAIVGTGNREDRMEERMARGWGSRPGYGTLDDWAV